MKITIAMMMLLTFASTAAFSATKAKGHSKTEAKMELTTEQRQSMAAAHEKMAACLRSDSSFETCHKDMMQSCKDVMGKDMCPMMGHPGMGKGMMHDESKMEDKKTK